MNLHLQFRGMSPRELSIPVCDGIIEWLPKGQSLVNLQLAVYFRVF
jgi:hypothetical protein